MVAVYLSLHLEKMKINHEETKGKKRRERRKIRKNSVFFVSS
jgi:hypothetical protein